MAWYETPVSINYNPEGPPITCYSHEILTIREGKNDLQL